MMNSPFHGRSYWNLPSSRPHSNNAPSVREIPVQFFGSEEKRPSVKVTPSRSDSAAKIQKVLKGFMVRKSMKKIAEIRREVEEIEKRISNEETIDLIAKDSKERLGINEILMSLLFRLDSVRGVDSGIRDCRKAVIKKAIALQELLDAVVSTNNNKNDQNREKVVESVDDQNPTAQVESTEDGEKAEALDEKEAIENQNDVGGLETDRNENNNGEAEDVVEDFDVMPSVDVGRSQTESQTDSSDNPEACEQDEISSHKQENNASETLEAEEVEENVKESGAKGEREDDTKNRELLKRMMEDNERMMDLMLQLFERNEMQTRLLSSLSQRVEQLERAFLCERLRRRKKRTAVETVDGCETSPDSKRCGKRE